MLHMHRLSVYQEPNLSIDANCGLSANSCTVYIGNIRPDLGIHSSICFGLLFSTSCILGIICGTSEYTSTLG